MKTDLGRIAQKIALTHPNIQQHPMDPDVWFCPNCAQIAVDVSRFAEWRCASGEYDASF